MATGKSGIPAEPMPRDFTTALRGARVLVTGADGFIGSHLVERLVARGAIVTAFAQYNSFGTWGWLDTLDAAVRGSIKVVAGDIRDRSVVRSAMRECEVVLHLAALISIPYSYVAPQHYVETNIVGTLNVLEAARELNVGRVVHTSTSEVYGSARFVPITEEHPLQAQSPYAATKIGADQLALSYHRSFGLPVAVLRPFNTYGPRQSTRAVIPAIISQIAAGKPAIALGNTHTTRDFTYVTDTAEGFIRAAAEDRCVGKVVNLGAGFEISVGDVVKLIAEILDRQVTIAKDERRVRAPGSEVERLHAGVQKARDLFDWRPEFGGLEGFKKGMAKTVAWFTDPANLRHYAPEKFTL